MSDIKVAISQDFMMAFSRLTRVAQKRVMEFVTKFRHDPRSPGINYEKLNIAADARYRSVRIDQNHRGIVLQPEKGNIYLLLWVDKHDDAYDWARRHTCQVHPETGELQLFESRTLDAHAHQPTLSAPAQVVPAAPVQIPKSEAQGASSPLFDLSEHQLLSIGVPPESIAFVSSLATEAELETAEKNLPTSAFEALYLLAAGTSWDDISKEYVRADSKPIDTTDVEAALERAESQRVFWVVDDELELREMLEAPLERWRVFLHPSQRKIVNRGWNGPVRVLGGAGTGKTVAAMHRAKWLTKNILNEKEQKILFTTFTANLATDIEHNLLKICSSEQLARIEIVHIDRWVSNFLKGQKYPHSIVYKDRDRAYEEIWSLALGLADASLAFPDSFYTEEWERVILPQRILTKADYFKAKRTGRGVALNRRQRAAIWPVFEEVRSQLHHKGLRTFEDATLDAVDILKTRDVRLPYRSVVVDEAQDMGPEALTLIRHLVPESDNDLFIVGDGHQRIYRRIATMSSCGIKIVGRSRKLRINYRTTEETRRYATAILENIPVDDLDGGSDSINDCRSLMHGEAPEILGFANGNDEATGIADKIRSIEATGQHLQDICVTARTKRLRDDLAERLEHAGLPVVKLEQKTDNRSVPGVRLATMHRIKGLEFRYVFLASANKGTIPLDVATKSTEDPVETRQRDLNERALMHVALTRAISKVFVSYFGEPSPYL